MTLEQLIHLLSSSGSIGLVFGLLYLFKGHLAEIAQQQEKKDELFWHRIDRLTDSFQTVTRATVDGFKETVESFRGDINRISQNTTEAITALTVEVKALSLRFEDPPK